MAVGVAVSSGVDISAGVAVFAGVVVDVGVDVAVWVGVSVGVGASVLSGRLCAGGAVRPPPFPTPVWESEAGGSSLSVCAGVAVGVDRDPGVGVGIVAGVDLTGVGVAGVEVDRGVVIAGGAQVSVGIEAVGDP